MLEKTCRPPCLFDKLQLLFVQQKLSNFFIPIKRQCLREKLIVNKFRFLLLESLDTRVLIQFHISAIMISNRIPLFFIVKTKRINKSIERKKEKERKIGLSIVVDYLLINK